MAKKRNYVNWDTFKLVVGGLCGLLLLVYYQVDINRDRVSSVEGDIKMILERTEWLQEEKDRYEERNGKVEIQGFLKTIISKKN
jgi:hypothetical protein|tara:strand:- start:107 stop:358 length:252 start_codon:yes stop_codon:yes gene_type:complete